MRNQEIGGPRNQLTGAGFKPPEGAVIKSHGTERSGQSSRAYLEQVGYQETSESKPFD